MTAIVLKTILTKQQQKKTLLAMAYSIRPYLVSINLANDRLGKTILTRAKAIYIVIHVV